MQVLHIDENHPSLAKGIASLGLTNHFDFQSDKKSIQRKIADFQGLVIRSRFSIDQDFLDAAKNLRFIIRVGAGLENIDIKHAKKRRIYLINAPEGNANAVGEHALGMLLALFNRLSIADYEIKKNGSWRREANRGEELSGKTVGIIGYGNMGKSFARKLKGFDVDVICYDLKKWVGDDFARQVPIKELQERATVLSIHTPENELSKKMVNTAFIARFQHPFYLINTARGSAVVTKDLVKALDTGKIRGACLDVLEYEKKSFEDFFQRQAFPVAFKKLLAHSNVLLSPHVAGWSSQSHERLARVCLDKLNRYLFLKNV